MPAGTKLLEANQLSTDLLLRGVTVPGLDGWDGGRDQTINYIDWGNWSANDFLAVSQFRVATPGQAKDIRPDVMLFVNGIPLVVIEAKPPGTDSRWPTPSTSCAATPTSVAVRSPKGRSSCSGPTSSSSPPPVDQAEVGTFSARPSTTSRGRTRPHDGRASWRSARQAGRQCHQQELLIAGMLAPERLLDIVRHFTLFMKLDRATTIKIVARYQQYRACQQGARPAAAPARRRQPMGSRPSRRHRLAHPGLGQEPDDGVPGPGDAHPTRTCAGSRSSSSPTAPTCRSSSPRPPRSPARRSRSPATPTR